MDSIFILQRPAEDACPGVPSQLGELELPPVAFSLLAKTARKFRIFSHWAQARSGQYKAHAPERGQPIVDLRHSRGSAVRVMP